jgi:hypothetical protein
VTITSGTDPNGYYSIVGNSVVLTLAGAAHVNAGGTLPTISVTASDGLLTATDTVAPSVTYVNDTPIGVADTLAATEDTPLVFAKSQLLTNDTDQEGNTLSIATVTSGTGGTVSLDGNGDVVFTPTANFNGAATFTYTVSDGNTVSSPVTVTVNVAAVDDAPTAENATVTLGRNTSHVLGLEDLGFNDVDGDTLDFVKINTLPATGSLLFFNGTSWVSATVGQNVSLAALENGYLVYKPVANAGGDNYASFNFSVSSDNGVSYHDVSTLTFDVNNVLTVSSPQAVDEGRAAVFVVELGDPRAVATQFSLNVTGTATAGVDYANSGTGYQYRVQNLDGSYSAWTNVSGAVTLAAGLTRMEVRVKTISDAVENESESLSLTATINVTGVDPTPAASMANISATGETIISDRPSLQLSGGSYVSEGADAVFDLELSSDKATSTVVTISFGGSATLGIDFVYSVDGGTTWISDATKNITIPADDAGQNISSSFAVLVRTISDATFEAADSIRLIATTADTAIANNGVQLSASTIVVDPITITAVEDVQTTLTPDAGYTYSILGDPAHGTVVQGPSGTLLYTSDSN